ncbi:hypothetical protein P170DRAFT_478385 [Aspergillus steynii IBT 23096]|uniref:Uncharacterized protein n=1 Tax=Aspergillus steynii IBT 23096 TaxID=1392250 RepID=A0A2I2FXR1_9EURO|nr:uncharacterized protein P170DRAFT_478385 [Aspergillus steynii IBT 23096]PLB45419.1 hypothetical protein P170DRAFT_478385 [Aspergillus steynii IBT 23096]
MFCLRSWLPLLFIPTNASPLFIISFVTLTYVLHRPCIYCSALLLILFISSCHWSDRCFFDLRGDWFAPRFTTTSGTVLPAGSDLHSSSFYSPANASMLAPSETLAEYVWDTVNTTTKALAGAVVDEAQRRLALNGTSAAADAAGGMSDLRQDEWTGIGLEWLRSLLGRREWTLPCVDVKIRL